MKCKYCEQEALCINPYNNTPMCGFHAQQKMEQLRQELNYPLADTLKDWFLLIEKDPKPLETSFDTKTGNIIRRK